MLRVIRNGVADQVGSQRQRLIVIDGLAIQIGGDRGLDFTVGVISGVDRGVVFGTDDSGIGRQAIGLGLFRGVRAKRRRVVRARLEHDVRHLRLGIAVAQLDQCGGKFADRWQLRLDRIELLHDLVDGIDGATQQLHPID